MVSFQPPDKFASIERHFRWTLEAETGIKPPFSLRGGFDTTHLAREKSNCSVLFISFHLSFAIAFLDATTVAAAVVKRRGSGRSKEGPEGKGPQAQGGSPSAADDVPR